MTRIRNLANCCFLSLSLVSAAAVGQEVELRRPVAGPAGQDLEITSIRPKSVEVVANGSSVHVVLQGRNLDRVDLQGEVLRSGHVTRSIVVSFDRPADGKTRNMKLTASTQAVRGPHSVRLKAGTQIIDLPLQVQVLHPEQAAPLNAATPRAAAAERGAVQQSAADQRQQARPSSAARPPVTGVSQQPAKSSSRNILTAANDNLVVIIPHLVVQTGTKEFESYATALGFASPEKLTFQWSHSNPEVKSGQWEVTHDNFVVMKGSAGAAPPPGQVKNFDIDFRGFVNLPAPGDPVRYRVRVRGMKALIPESETSIRAARVDEPVAATASSPAAATVDDESLFVTPLSNAVVITYASQVDSVFTEEGLELPWPERDDDHDGFKNGEEDALAAQFRPYFIFDAEESDRRQGEPVVIYQVQCVGRAEWCTTAHIRYYFLFREDGGWQSCSPWCNNAHNGDNQAFDIDVLRHAAEPDDPYTYWYMVWGADRFQYTHPILYLAAGKHHNYLSTSWNHVDDGGCCDDVAGDGDQIFPDVVTDGRYHNVGERNAPLIDDLGFLGYPGECAWCGKAFRGGLEDDEGDSEPFEWF